MTYLSEFPLAYIRHAHHAPPADQTRSISTSQAEDERRQQEEKARRNTELLRLEHERLQQEAQRVIQESGTATGLEFTSASDRSRISKNSQ